MSNLIFVVGKKRSGKDTVSDYITTKHKGTKYQLAGPIKQTLYHCSRHLEDSLGFRLSLDDWMGEGRVDREQVLLLSNREAADFLTNCVNHLKVRYNLRMLSEASWVVEKVVLNNNEPWSMRRFMQTLGTDIVCNQLDRMFWLKLFGNVYIDQFEETDYFVVPDTRQDHELSCARAMGATVIHVVRPEQEAVQQDTHITEAGLPIRNGDIVIMNDGALEDLFNKIDSTLEKIKAK